MILVIDALNRTRFEDVLDDMFQLRARVFAGRLGWEVEVADGREIDRFDALDPAYVVGLDGAGRVVSCARLLQTTGPHMLADVFDAILEGQPAPRSARLWESTRFCVDTARLDRGTGVGSIARATSELMVGTLEYARASGIRDIVTVIDPVMDRVLKRSGNAPHGYVGSAAPMGKVSALAALLDCTEERIARVRAHAGIEGRVLATEDEAEALLARARGEARAPRITPDDVYSYCVDQIRSARTEEDREAAFAVVRELIARARGTRAPAMH